MKGCAIVATHHKTGTAWMTATFRQLCQRLNVPFFLLDANAEMRREDCRPPILVRATHSKFANCRWLIEDPQHKVFHLIRDPRDVIISGMHYHRSSKEPWLHRKRADFDGSSYQEKLNGLDTDRARYLFEMANSGKATTMSMARWNYRRPNFFECKYEDLIADVDMSLFGRIVLHLGFAEEELEVCREVFWKNSLFGKKGESIGKKLHLRSGDARQWKNVFDRGLAEAFLSRFGDALIKLGYERDDSWIEDLPAVSGRLDLVDA